MFWMLSPRLTIQVLLQVVTALPLKRRMKIATALHGTFICRIMDDDEGCVCCIVMMMM